MIIINYVKLVETKKLTTRYGCCFCLLKEKQKSSCMNMDNHDGM